MSRPKKIILCTVGVVVLALGIFLIPTIWFKPWSIDHFYMRTFASFALRHPMMLSSMRLLEPMGIDFYDDDLDDMSMEFDEREARWVRKLSFDILEWFLVDIDDGNRYMYHDYPVNQLFGIQSGLPDFMINTHQINNPGDAKDYVARPGARGPETPGGAGHRTAALRGPSRAQGDEGFHCARSQRADPLYSLRQRDRRDRGLRYREARRATRGAGERDP
jgi:hypothetical protein